MQEETILDALKSSYPGAVFCGCSTSGEIANESVKDGTAVITGIQFDKTTAKAAKIHLSAVDFNSTEAGKKLVSQLPLDSLKHVLVISDGLKVNGTDLVKGMTQVLPSSVTITGGLAGDGANFQQTSVIEPDGTLTSEVVVAIGLYGDALTVGYSSRGGWDSFGVDRQVTRSTGNILFEIDGQPALDLYKSFLGDEAKGLPASGLLFPLSMRDREDRTPVVRTILAINETDKSLTFAGDIPEGSFVKLMKANNDRLINGAEEAAKVAAQGLNHHPEFALLVSCIGRKLVLKQMVEEEVEVVSEVLNRPVITGFYSYGELAPFDRDTQCDLHNQTMTITTLSEA